jgi:hypothetical protein
MHFSESTIQSVNEKSTFELSTSMLKSFALHFDCLLYDYSNAAAATITSQDER